MNKTAILALGLLLAAPAASAPAPEHSGGDVARMIERFEDPERRAWQKPLQVLDALGLREGEVVADIGAGSGYFTGLLSVQVGQTGKVYAVDVEQQMLDHIKTRFDVSPDVVYVLADPDDPGLPEEGIDLILMVNTWHHIEKRPKYLKKLAAALNPDGRFALIDFREGDLPVGPPADHKLARDQVLREFEKGKWTLAADYVMLPYQYFLVFYPPE